MATEGNVRVRLVHSPIGTTIRVRETLKGLGEKQHSKHDVLALMPIYSKRFWTRNNFVT